MNSMIRKTVDLAARAVAPGVYDVTLSTSGLDRERDRILASGWEIPARVPLLWSHDPRQLPLGRVTNIRIDGERLRGRMEFAPREIHAFAGQVADLIDAGFLRSVSVGFRPLEPPQRNDEGGYTFTRQELLELSVVNVPAHPGATIGAEMAAAVEKWYAADEPVIELLDDETIEFRDEDFLPALRAGLRQAFAQARRPDAAQLSGLLGERRAHQGPVYDVDVRELGRLIAEVVTETRRAVIGEHVRRALDRIRGRVD